MALSIHWPVGCSLRFNAKVATLRGCTYLAETAVIVLTPPQLVPMPKSLGSTQPQQLQQKVYAFAAGGECWVQPEFLEPIPVSMLSAYRSRRWPVQKS
ncbi:MAG: hypothetical protein V4607_05590 [Pseudomonadota bacterium]